MSEVDPRLPASTAPRRRSGGDCPTALLDLASRAQTTTTAVRVARPTDQLDEVVRFYREGLGLPELDRFAGHVGYRGVLLGLPARSTIWSSPSMS